MYQKNISEYYRICKRKLDNLQNNQSNLKDDELPAKKIKLDDDQNRSTSLKQTKLLIDYKSNKFLIKSKTVLDRFKSSFKDNFKKPQEKGLSIIKSHLSDTNSKLDNLYEKIIKLDKKINSNRPLLDELIELRKQTRSLIKEETNSSTISSSTNDLNNKDQRRTKANELINLSANKLFENKPINENIPPKEELSSDDYNLPDKYLELAKIFNKLDQVAAIMYNRSEICTFNKVKSIVQNSLKREFNLDHLAQIKTIYPNSYSLSFERLNCIVDKNRTDLIIRPNVITTKITPYTTRMRNVHFKDNLILFAKKVHQNYLLSLNIMLPLNGLELTRWYPSFVFPDIPKAKLPEQIKNSNALNSFSDFWSIKFNYKNDEEFKCSIDEHKTKIKKGLLKGLSLNFVTKIKIKDERLAREKKLRKDANKVSYEKTIIELKKLPELVRTISSVFAIKERKSILLKNLIEELVRNSTRSSDECLKLIKLTNELLPDWLLILPTSKGTFIKINNKIALKTIYDRIEINFKKIKN